MSSLSDLLDESRQLSAQPVEDTTKKPKKKSTGLSDLLEESRQLSSTDEPEFALKKLMETEELTPEQEAEASAKIKEEDDVQPTKDLETKPRNLELDEEAQKLADEEVTKPIGETDVEHIKNLEGWHTFPKSKEEVEKLVSKSVDKLLTVGYGKLVAPKDEGESEQEYVDKVWALIESGTFDSYSDKDSAADELAKRVEKDKEWVVNKLDPELAKSDKLVRGLTSYRYNYPDIADTIKSINNGDISRVVKNMYAASRVTQDGEKKLVPGLWERRKTELKLVLEGLAELHSQEEPAEDVAEVDMSEFTGGGTGAVDPVVQMKEGTYVDPGIITGERPVSMLKPLPRDTKDEVADADVVTIGELQRMMKRHGVPRSKLAEVKELARFYGADTPGSYDRMAEAKGKWSDIVLLGLPQKLSILTEDDESMAELADELRATALQRKSAGEQLGELGLGMLAPQLLAAKGVKSLMAIGAGTGALAGVGMSRSGEEIEQALIGGGLGVALTGALAGVSRYAFRRGRVPKPVMEEAEELSETVRNLPKPKKIEMAEEMDKVWEDVKAQEAGARMDAYLTEVFTKVEKPEQVIPSFEKFKLNNGLRKPPKLQIKKVSDIAEAFGDEDYIIKVGDAEYFVRRPTRESKEWALGTRDNYQIDWGDNYKRLADIKEHLIEVHSRPTKNVDFLRQLSDEQVKLLKEQGENLMPTYLRGKGNRPEVYLAYKNHIGEIGRLKKWLGTKTDDEFLDEIKTQDTEFILNQWRRMREADHLASYLKREKLIGQDEWSSFRKTINQIIDVKYVARQFDDKFNSNFEIMIDKVSEKLNTISYVRAGALKRMSRLRKVMNKSGLTQEEVYDYLDTGKLPGNLWERAQISYKGESINVLEEWRYFFNDLLEEANQLGLPITKTKNYVPRQRPNVVEYVRKLDAKLKESVQETGVDLTTVDISGKSFSELLESSPATKQLAQEMKSVLDEVPTSSKDFRRLFELLANPNDIQTRSITQARAAIKRSKETLPDWVREKNLYELTKNWTSNTFRHAALREEIADLEQFKRIIQKQGDVWGTKYVDDLQRDIVGTRTDTVGRGMMKAAQMTEIKLNRMADRLEEAGREWTAKSVRSLTYVPEVYQMLAQSIYPNLLGGSIRASLQNILSAPIMSAPELGATYGSYVSTKGMMNTLGRTKVKMEITADMASVIKNKLGLSSPDITPRKLAQLEKLEEAGILSRTDTGWKVNIGATLETADSDIILGAQGILPAQWTGELSAQLRSELKRSSLYHFSANVYEKWTTVSMAMFEASERLARMQTYHIADQVARDFIGGQASAKKWFDNLSSNAYKRQIKKAMDLGDEERVRHLVQRYFQSTNMFNYDRANMSALGRHLGPLFSTFTKWPLAMGGRVAHELYDRQTQGLKKLGIQLIAPFMAASLVNSMMDNPDENPHVRIMFGSRGLTSLTPLNSFTSFLTGEFATPPIVQQMQAISDAVGVPDEDTPDRVSKALQNSASIFVPGANILRILGEDIPQLMGVNIRQRARGIHRGKGKLERQAAEAARLLDK